MHKDRSVSECGYYLLVHWVIAIDFKFLTLNLLHFIELPFFYDFLLNLQYVINIKKMFCSNLRFSFSVLRGFFFLI